MKSSFTRLHAIAAASALLAAASITALVTAGPLDPPAGPITPAYKTLDQVEPRTPLSAQTTPGNATALYIITQPGSYYLTGNVTVANNVAAIRIAADNVQVDLSGFTVARSGSGPSTQSLITTNSGFDSNTTVRNGTVSNSGLHGVALGGFAHVDHLRVLNSAQDGIITTSRSTITDCTVEVAGARGVAASSECIVERNLVSATGAYGIEALDNSRVQNCTVRSAVQAAIHIGNQVHVRGCSIYDASTIGIDAFLNTVNQVIQDNTIYYAPGGGVRVYHYATVARNTLQNPTNAGPCIIVMKHGNRIEANSCHGGSDAVKIDPAAANNLVIGNFSINAAVGNGFANVALATNVVGPVHATQGTISTSNPWANFTR